MQEGSRSSSAGEDASEPRWGKGSADESRSGSGSTDEPAKEAPDGPSHVIDRLFRNGRTNAILSWLLVGVLFLVFVESLLDFDILWVTFVAATAMIVLLPPLAYREWRVMLPWELLVLALLPILVRAVFGGELGTFAYYLSIAALALLITVELHTFTSLRVTHWFAVAFVVMTTLASVAVWSIVRWTLDWRLGTSFLAGDELGQDAANAALMVEFGYVTLAGLAAGILFDAYFRRRDRRLARAIRRAVQR